MHSTHPDQDLRISLASPKHSCRLLTPLSGKFCMQAFTYGALNIIYRTCKNDFVVLSNYQPSPVSKMSQRHSSRLTLHADYEMREASSSSKSEDFGSTDLGAALFMNLRSEIGQYDRYSGRVSISILKPVIYVEKLYRNRDGSFRMKSKKKAWETYVLIDH
jgi:hypothetical protein